MLLKPANPRLIRSGRDYAGAWLFAEGNGNQAADSTRDANYLSLSNPAWTPAIDGPALACNPGFGQSDRPFMFGGNAPRTILASIRLRGNPSGGASGGTICAWGINGTGQLFQFRVNPLRELMLQVAGAGGATTSLSGTLSIGSQHRAALAFRGPTVADVEFFLDGSPIGISSAGSQAVNTSTTNPLRIGLGWTANTAFPGDIASVQVVRGALSAHEMSQWTSDPYADFRWSRSSFAVAHLYTEVPTADPLDPPTITGTAIVGGLFSIDYVGGWISESPILGYEYRWQRSNDDGETWEDIPDADAIDYMMRVADIGWRIRAGVLAGNDGGVDETQWAWSAWSEPVPPPGPAFTYLTISATPSLMSTISATPSLIGAVSRGP